MNVFSVPTVYSNLGIDRYPSLDEIRTAARKICPQGHEIPATRTAADLGSPQMTNVIMLGALTKVDELFDYDRVRALVEEISPVRFREKNMAGFEAGYNLV